MDNKLDDTLLIMQANTEAHMQDYDEKTKKLTEDLTEMITPMMDQIKISKSSPDNKYSPKAQDPTTVVPANKKDPPFEGGSYMKFGGMWTLKHDIISTKFYELLINKELKVDTDMDLKNFYNHIKMSLNAVTRLLVDLLPSCQSIKRHSDFEEYFIPDRDHPSHAWNFQIYTSLVQSLLMEMIYDTCVKSSMESQFHKVVSTHGHEILG